MGDFEVNDELIKKYQYDSLILKFYKTKFKLMTDDSIIILNKMIFENKFPIHISNIKKNYSKFYHRNMSKFDSETKNLKPNEIHEIKTFVLDVYKSREGDVELEEDENEVQDTPTQIKAKLNKNTSYKNIMEFIEDKMSNITFTYDFENPDLKFRIPNNNHELQLCKIQILTAPEMFKYPINYSYHCYRCKHNVYRKPYDVSSSPQNSIKCPGEIITMDDEGNPKVKICGNTLLVDEKSSLTRDAYHYQIAYYNNEGTLEVGTCHSFLRLRPGFYDAALFHSSHFGAGNKFFVMDVKKEKINNLVLPDKVSNENYVFTLQRCFDDFIEQQARIKIYGLIPIKVSLILQTAANILGLPKNFNVMLVGDSSTGKSMILRYYCYLLNDFLNSMTSGVNVSVPGLRGYTQTINVGVSKDIKIITLGLLGKYRSICIDEAGQNKEMVEHLKSFLFDETYQYTKAGGEGVTRRRMAHVNLSENINNDYLQQYNASIKKAYKEINYKIGEFEKEEWDETWDLHLPIIRYDWNPYLLKVIKNKRQLLANSNKWWIDGHDEALHQRFPFYFFLTRQKDSVELDNAAKKHVGCEVADDNELKKLLYNSEIEDYIKSLQSFVKPLKMEEMEEIDKVLKGYGVDTHNIRLLKFYYTITNLSRILNKRNEMDDTDLHLLKIIIENTNCKIDVSNMIDYTVKGGADLTKIKETEKLIEESKNSEDLFGIPEDDFK